MKNIKKLDDFLNEGKMLSIPIGTILQLKGNSKFKYVVANAKLVNHYQTNKPEYFYTLNNLDKGSHKVDGVKYKNSVGGILIYHHDLIDEYEIIK